MAINDVLNVKKDGLMYQGFNLARFVPSYVVKKTGEKCLNSMFTVYLARKHPQLKLHVMAFALACKTKFLGLGIDPDSEYTRVHVKKNYHYYHKGKLRKENNKIMKRKFRYLKIVKKENHYRGSHDTYYFVHASFKDNNSPSYLGFSVQACSINVTLHVAKEARKMLDDLYGGDYAKLFRDFLFWVGYPECVYITAGQKGALSNLKALERKIEESIVEGSFT